MQSADLKVDQNRLILSGDLNFQSVVPLREKAVSVLRNINNVTIDFSQVNTVNSAALALIVSLLNWSSQHHKTISFSGFPPKLASLLEISGVANLIAAF